MTGADLQRRDIDQLVDEFSSNALAQDKADEADDMEEYRRLYREMEKIDKELRRRGPDARLALLRLYPHPNAQVRLQAARLSYGVRPEAARKCLQTIFDSKMPPQYLDAGMSLAALDNGTSMLD